LKVLVTGARGLLGTYLIGFLRKNGDSAVGWDLPEHDVTEVETSIGQAHEVGPDVIVHLAAWTDVDGCESDVGRATAVNFQGSWAMAIAAAELRCPILYVSTDYVFDGRLSRPYRESDPPNPLSAYGRTKLLGEQAVARLVRRHFVLRTSWLYGGHGRNFVETIRSRCRSGEIDVVNDQRGSPTFARDLCRPLWELIHSDKYGTYHLTNGGSCSWFELAQEVVRLSGGGCRVRPISSDQLARPARRPANSVLENRNFRRRFNNVLRPWQDALAAYIGESSGPSQG
jgi:dTDP-4-dehydrorhamnose reductase